MALKDSVGTGVLVAGVAAATMMAQNQLQISGSGRQLPPVQQGTLSDAAAGAGLGVPLAGTRAAFVDADPLTLNRIGDRSYKGGILLYNPNCADETVSLMPQFLDRNGDPLSLRTTVERIGRDGKPAVVKSASADAPRWQLKPGEYDCVRLSVALDSSSADEPGKWNAVWAGLVSSPMNYAEWTGHLPARGTLVLTLHTPLTDPASKDACRITGAVPATVRRSLVLQPPLPSPVDTAVLLGSLVLALLTTIIAAAIIAASSNMFLRGRMGDVTFDFKGSWGANVAIGAGILAAPTSGTVISPSPLTRNVPLSSGAPKTFNSIRSPGPRCRSGGVESLLSGPLAIPFSAG